MKRKKMKFSIYSCKNCKSSNFLSENGMIFLDGSNPGIFSRKNYENLCYLLDIIGKLSVEVKKIIQLGSKFKKSNNNRK